MRTVQYSSGYRRPQMKNRHERFLSRLSETPIEVSKYNSKCNSWTFLRSTPFARPFETHPRARNQRGPRLQRNVRSKTGITYVTGLDGLVRRVRVRNALATF